MINNNSNSNQKSDTSTLFKTGNDNPIKQDIFEVGGMACAFCASTIEESLSKVVGIQSVKVLMNTSEVVVRYNSKEITHDSVKKHLIGLGYYAFDESEKSHSDVTVLSDSRKRALAAAIITAPITIISFLSQMVGLFDFGTSFKILEMVASASVLFYFGFPIHVGAFNALRRGILNEHVLYGAAGFAAFGVGLISLFYSTVPDFFTVAALLTTFHLSAGWYGAKVRHDTTKSLRKILNLQPPMARVIKEKKDNEKKDEYLQKDKNEIEKIELQAKEEISIPVTEVKINDLIIIKGGEKIPVDGIIESGESTISEAILTGESEPIYKTIGDNVLAGSTNGDGMLIIRASRVGSESMIMRVAGNVKRIQESKPTLLTIFDKVIDKFVLLVLVFTAFTAVLWILYNLVTGANQWLQTIYAPLSVLVIGYPCAIGLSTPPVKLRAISFGADKGVLINDATSLFSIIKSNTIMLDKTGTITEGRPKVNKISVFNGNSKQMLLEYAANIERGSSHPIAKAILEEADKNNIKLLRTIENIRQFPGKGVKGLLEGKEVIIGNLEFLKDNGINVYSNLSKQDSFNLQSIDSPVFVAADSKFVGVLGISDTIRDGMKSTIKNLLQAGFEIFMLTGDTKKVAEKVAIDLGINNFQAKMSPMEKADFIKNLQTLQKRTVIAVGDGVNDAPALAQADVGIAVGSGIDISKETASIVLLSDDIGIIPTLTQIGKRFTSSVKRNILLALTFNAIGIPIAAMGFLNPFVAMMIMIVDVAAVFVSTWLFRPIKSQSTKPKSKLKEEEEEEEETYIDKINQESEEVKKHKRKYSSKDKS